MSLVIQLLLWIIHHQLHLLRYGHHHPRVFRHVVMLRQDLSWLLNHVPASNKLRPKP